jgi:hypothetical protein
MKFHILAVKPVDIQVSHVQANPIEFTYVLGTYCILFNFFAKRKDDNC